MRIGVLSDIHGNLPALEAVCADLVRHSVDCIVNLGDSLSGPLLPKETAEFLMSKDWVHLAGNHERQLLELNDASGESDKYAYSQLSQIELDWIAQLKPVKQFDEEVLLCHGTPKSDLTALLETTDRRASADEIEDRLGKNTSAVVLCGHSHVPRSVRSKKNILIVNPGSVGLQAYTETQPFPHKVETGSPDARYAIIEKRNHGWFSTLFSIPYDFREMTRLARQRGRFDWESALVSGYILE